MHESSFKKVRLDGLDLLRAVAVLLVLVNHFLAEWNFSLSTFYIGGSGIDLFFLVSGFVIPYSIKNKNNIFQFLKKRWLRLYPVFLVCFGITIVFYFLNPHKTYTLELRDFLLNLTMFPQVFHAQHLDNSYWTLAIEWEFYFLFGIIIYFFNEKVWLGFSLGLLFFSLLLNFYIDNWLQHSIWPANVLHYFRYIRYHALFFGGWICFKLFSGDRKIIYYVLLIYCYVHQSLLYPRLYDNAVMINDATIYRLFLAGYFLLMIFFSLQNAEFNFGVPGMILLIIGRGSYPLYLIHQYVGRHFAMPLLIYDLGISWPWAFLISLLLVLSISLTVHNILEKKWLGLF